MVCSSLFIYERQNTEAKEVKKAAKMSNLKSSESFMYAVKWEILCSQLQLTKEPFLFISQINLFNCKYYWNKSDCLKALRPKRIGLCFSEKNSKRNCVVIGFVQVKSRG